MSQQICPQCSQAFECGADNPNQTCWCMELPVLNLATEQVSASCWCPNCLGEQLKKQVKKSPTQQD